MDTNINLRPSSDTEALVAHVAATVTAQWPRSPGSFNRDDAECAVDIAVLIVREVQRRGLGPEPD